MVDPTLEALEAAWRRSDRLFGLLRDEAWLRAAIPLRHPFVFYLGHLPAFAWNQVGRGVLGRGDLDAELDELFERGIDPLDEAEAAREAISDWPRRSVIEAYRDRSREALRAAWDDVGARADEDPLADRHRIYHLVLEHELMHHETLVYMLLELDPALRGDAGASPPVLGRPAPAADTVRIPAGRVELGVDRDELEFTWDNESPRREQDVEAFEIDRWPVTVADFRRFQEEGGYEDEALWTPEDWAWIRGLGRDHPHAWAREPGPGGAAWTHRTWSGRVPLDQVGAWPAVVSCAEAEAYARWSGARLPDEAQLVRAARGRPDGAGQRRYPWGDAPPGASHGNFGFRRFDPTPVDAHPAGASAFGVHDLMGNGWEWSSTVFEAHPGFEAWMRTYPGYSRDFFDGQHHVIYGAAWPTDERLLRPSFRNWFQRRYPWVLASFRLVRS